MENPYLAEGDRIVHKTMRENELNSGDESSKMKNPQGGEPVLSPFAIKKKGSKEAEKRGLNWKSIKSKQTEEEKAAQRRRDVLKTPPNQE